MRDQWRRAALRGGRGHRGGGAGAAGGGGGHPLPQRLRMRGGQQPGGGAGWRRHGAGHGGRHRRAGGQHRPAHGHRRPGAEDGPHLRRPRKVARPDRGGPVRGGAVQQLGADEPPLRGRHGLRPQGRPAWERHRSVPGRLRARGAGAGGESPAPAGERAGGQGDPGVQGGEPRARPDGRRGGRAGHPGRHQGARGRGLLLRGGRWLAGVADPPPSGLLCGRLHP